jgi:hypothetical protein
MRGEGWILAVSVSTIRNRYIKYNIVKRTVCSKFATYINNRIKNFFFLITFLLSWYLLSILSRSSQE